jgi:predicted MFS family arabinose efflux permease
MSGSIWRDRNFVLFWLAQTVSDLGSAVTELALPLAALLVLHVSAFEVGLLRAAEVIPYLLLALAAGVVVDRSHPAKLLIGSDLGRALILGTVPVAFFLGHLTMLHLYLAAFTAGSLTVLFGVAQQAAVHGLVERERLIDANSKIGMSGEAAQVAGPGFGGVLISAISAPAAVLLDAVSFLFSAALLSRIRWHPREQSTPAPREPFLRQVREGLAFILRRPVHRALAICLSILNFFLPMFWTVALVYFVRDLHLVPSTIGLVLAAGGLGGVAGAASANVLNRHLGVGRTIVAGAAPFGVLLIPLAPMAFPVPWLVAGGFLSGFSLVAFNVSQLGLRQAMTPSRLQGRMTASMRFLIQVPAPLGPIIGGALGVSIGLRPALWVASVGALLAVVPLLSSPLPAIPTTSSVVAYRDD